MEYKMYKFSPMKTMRRMAVCAVMTLACVSGYAQSKDFEKLEDKERLAKINEEFPKYRVVKVQEGFMQIFGQHLGVVEAVEE